MLSVWPARLTVRTQDSQSCNTGSIPVRATTVRHASVSASVRLGMPTCFGETSARLALAPLQNPAKTPLERRCIIFRPSANSLLSTICRPLSPRLSPSRPGPRRIELDTGREWSVRNGHHALSATCRQALRQSGKYEIPSNQCAKRTLAPRWLLFDWKTVGSGPSSAARRPLGGVRAAARY